MCDDELENVLGLKALHVKQIRGLIEEQLKKVKITVTAKPKTWLERQFKVNADFLQLIQETHNTNDDKRLYSYQEIATLLYKYIIKNKEKLFDIRNPYVAIVNNDPLGKVFGVRAFHRDHVHRLLCRQLKVAKVSTSKETSQAVKQSTRSAERKRAGGYNHTDTPPIKLHRPWIETRNLNN